MNVIIPYIDKYYGNLMYSCLDSTAVTATFHICHMHHHIHTVFNIATLQNLSVHTTPLV